MHRFPTQGLAFFFAVVNLMAIGQGADAPQVREITFSQDIAAIIYQNCTSCHRNGQSGPFPLTNYEEISRHADTIAAVTEDRYMPPWKPKHGDVKFANNRELKPEQIDALKRWAAANCPPGDLTKAPKPPEFASEWALGTPDLILKMDEPFEVQADGPDVYRSFVLPASADHDRWIKAIEMHPSSPGVVHHALFFAVDSSMVRSQKANDGQPGLKGMGFLKPANGLQSGSFDRLASGLGGYVPGATPNRLPGDLAKLLPAGSDIIMQTHFHPTGKMEIEQSEIGIYFTSQEPSHRLVQVQIPALFGVGAGIDVPAGESNFTIKDSFRVPTDVLAHEVGGHAHYICKSMLMTAQFPSGEQRVLLNIEDWDLDWQDQYQFETPIELPAGTLITSEIVYDNSADNPENPNSPPIRITWGRESTDEMGSISLQLTAVNESQRSKLEDAVRERTRQSIRARVKNQAGPLGSLLGEGRLNNALLNRIDTNKDDSLQAAEIPERVRDRLLEFFDRNNDTVIDEAELKEARKNLKKLVEESDE